MKLEENRVELSIREGIEDFGFPSDIGEFGNKVIAAHEFVQDFQLNKKLLFSIRGEEITDQEIHGWHEAEKYLDELDWLAARERVCFLRDADGRRYAEDPYNRPEW
jgi:hypothetical protein